MTAPLIAIDGPAGSGKSTVAAALAARLGLARLDTGAMYRAVALLCLESGTDPGDAEACTALAEAMDLEMGERVVLNGRDVSGAIRSSEVDRAVSIVAAHRGVRAELVRRQREWAEAHDGGVVEGRDIGSVVFPRARLKVFLTAEAAERVRRRANQTGTSDRGSTEAHLLTRDLLDSSRAISPLAVAPDAIVVDSTGKTAGEVVEEVISHL